MNQPVRVRRGFSTNLDVVAGRIKELVDIGIRDGESRQLAVKLVSGSFDYAYDRRAGKEVPVVEAYGKHFYAPPGRVCKSRDDECEIVKIWDFLVLNVRYVYDPKPVDTFCTLKQSLLAGGGDCFPAGTLLLVNNAGVPALTYIENVQPGQRIWGRDRWSLITQALDKDVLALTEIQLSSGSRLELTEDHKVYIEFCTQGCGPARGSCTCDPQRRGFERIAVSQLEPGMSLIQPKRISVVPNVDRSLIFRTGSIVCPDRIVAAEARTRFRMNETYTTWAQWRDDVQISPGPQVNPRVYVEEIVRGRKTARCYDISTDDHYVYLPEHDVTVSNCDDATTAFATLLGCIGFSVMARIISKDVSPDVWEHIYPMCGVTKDDPRKWIPLDMTVDGVMPGWEYPYIGQHRDYLLV